MATVHFQRIAFHSSILKYKRNDLFTTSNKQSDDLVCANTDATIRISWIGLVRIPISWLTGERLLLWHSVFHLRTIQAHLFSCKKDQIPNSSATKQTHTHVYINIWGWVGGNSKEMNKCYICYVIDLIGIFPHTLLDRSRKRTVAKNLEPDPKTPPFFYTMHKAKTRIDFIIE